MLAKVTGKKASEDVFRPYANNFKYTAVGAVESFEYGNGRFETMKFNSRLQPTQIGLGFSASNQGLLKLDYEYNSTGNSDNNGNVLKQTITVPSVGQNNVFTAVQAYTYDELNRLKSAVENLTPSGGSQTETWKQTYTFDRYGNRRFDETNTTTLPKNCGTPPNQTVCPAQVPIVNPTIDPATNRLIGYTFDTAGNTKIDAEGRTFVYDAENKQIEVKEASSNVVGQYFYDGDGKRVKKYIPSTGETTIFVYDAGGKLIAEYSTIVEPTSTAQTSYLTNDHLGSPRAITSQFGQVTSRRDFQPYGEEIFSTDRTTGIGYSGDSVRQRFTSYERDNEIDLDFAQARYYSSLVGRFTTVDPLMASADIVNPQTFNRYTYVGNNPVNITDPTGEIWGFLGGDFVWYKNEAELKNAGATVATHFIGIINGAHYVLNPTNGTDRVLVASALQATQQLITWGATASQIIASGAMLGAEVAVITGGFAITVGASIGYLYYPQFQREMGCPAISDGCNTVGTNEILNNANSSSGDEASGSAGANTQGESSPADPNSAKPDPEDNKPATQSSKPPSFGKGWVKLRGSQGYKDPDGNIWKKDMLHKDHWDVSDRKGNKIREVDFNGRQIWPDGPKNKNKVP